MIRSQTYHGLNPNVGDETVFHCCTFTVPAAKGGGTLLFEGNDAPFTFVDCDLTDVRRVKTHNYINCRLRWSAGMQ